MTDQTTYTAEQMVQWATQNTAFDSPPSIVWVSLHTDDPTADGSQNEISDSGYSRQATDAPDDWDYDADSTSASNGVEIQFDAFDGDVGDVSHFALWDGDSETDNALFVSELNSTRTGMGSGDFIRFQTGELAVDAVEWSG